MYGNVYEYNLLLKDDCYENPAFKIKNKYIGIRKKNLLSSVIPLNKVMTSKEFISLIEYCDFQNLKVKIKIKNLIENKSYIYLDELKELLEKKNVNLADFRFYNFINMCIFFKEYKIIVNSLNQVFVYDSEFCGDENDIEVLKFYNLYID